jgi:hypothetical protein
VELVVDRLQVDAAQVRVHLRRADVGVAQHDLDRAEVRPVLQEVRRERVAQRVGVTGLVMPASDVPVLMICQNIWRVSPAAMPPQEEMVGPRDFAERADPPSGRRGGCRGGVADRYQRSLSPCPRPARSPRRSHPQAKACPLGDAQPGRTSAPAWPDCARPAGGDLRTARGDPPPRCSALPATAARDGVLPGATSGPPLPVSGGPRSGGTAGWPRDAGQRSGGRVPRHAVPADSAAPPSDPGTRPRGVCL